MTARSSATADSRIAANHRAFSTATPSSQPIADNSVGSTA